jgi:hypothetical protein
MNVHDPRALGTADPTEFDHVWKALEYCMVGERHFNDIQARYRTLASTWLLAAFGAAGFVVSSERFELPFDRALVIAAIGVAAMVGVLMLWAVDLLVYHQLLDGFFLEARRLEDAYPWVPPVRERQIASQVHGSVQERTVRFYQAGVVVLGVLLVAVPLAASSASAGWLATVAVAAVAVVTTAGVVFYMHWATKMASPLWAARAPSTTAAGPGPRRSGVAGRR